MPDTHCHRRGERCPGDSRLAPLPTTPAALIRASLFLFALLLFIAVPSANAMINIYCDPEASSGDPDDGDHRDSPTLMSALVIAEPLPAVTLAESTAPSLASPAVEPLSTGRAYALRRGRFLGQALLWSVVRIWMLHR